MGGTASEGSDLHMLEAHGELEARISGNAEVLGRSRIGRAADEGRESLHAANVVTARVLGEATHVHVLDHTLAQRAARRMRRIGGHRMLLSSRRMTLHARRPMPIRHL
jgi:hypothetical protein